MTRRCRASGRCTCCLPRRAAEATRGRPSSPSTRPSSTSSRRSRTCTRSSPTCGLRRWTSLGLRPALDALIESRGAHGALAITAQLTLPGPGDGDDRLAPEVESTIYRLAQEALTNVVKHAHARARAGDDRRRRAGTVVMEVRDDGVGFAADASTASGYGLANMRERVTLAGGTLAIESGPAGTPRARRAARTGARRRGSGLDRRARAAAPRDRPATRRLTYSFPRAALSTAGVSSASASCLTTKPIAPAPSACLGEDRAVLHRQHDDLRGRDRGGAGGGSRRCSCRWTCSGRSRGRPARPSWTRRSARRQVVGLGDPPRCAPRRPAGAATRGGIRTWSSASTTRIGTSMDTDTTLTRDPG